MGVLITFCSVVSATKATGDRKDSCKKKQFSATAFLSMCWPLHKLCEEGGGMHVWKLRCAQYTQNLKKLKFGYGNGSMVWKDLNCFIVV